MIVDLNVGVNDATSAEAVISSAKSAGLDGILITQVDQIPTNASQFKKAAETEGLRLFVGAQLQTQKGKILCILPDEARLPTFQKGEKGVYDASVVIDEIENQGGVTVAMRPYDRNVEFPMGDHLFSLQGLTACEVQSPKVSEVANDLALEAASNLEMPCVGSSSADGQDGIGKAATLFRTSIDSQTELCEAIRNGDCWPVLFAEEAPALPRTQDGGRRRRGNDDRRSNGARSGRGRGGGRRQMNGSGGGGGGGGGGGRRSNNSGGGSGGGRRGGGGGGRRRSDYGERLSPSERYGAQAAMSSDEAIGNRRAADAPLDADDDSIGNRLQPGESSPFRSMRSREVDDEDNA